MCLLDAMYKTGCLCASTPGQLHHSLQTGIGFLTYFTVQETVSHCEEVAELAFDPKPISWQITRYFPGSRPFPSSYVTLVVFPYPFDLTITLRLK